jgi:hypothetical protein
MLRTIKSLHNKLEGVPETVGDSVRKIEFSNGSRIRALHGDEKTVRGISAVSLALIDEAARVPEELLAAVRPMIATRSDGTLVALSTLFGKRGFFYEAWTGDAIWHRVKVPATDRASRKSFWPKSYASWARKDSVKSMAWSFSTPMKQCFRRTSSTAHSPGR